MLAVIIFLLRVVDVSMGTIRSLMVLRGQRMWAFLLGFIEITIWVIAIRQVLFHLNDLWNVLGYSGGFAMGTLLGMWIEERIALGYTHIEAITTSSAADIAHKVRESGYGATQISAGGVSGPVGLVIIDAPRNQVKNVMDLISRVDKDAYVTVRDIRRAVRGYYHSV